MEGYRVELAERTNLEARENSFALKLKTWCRMVKSEILSPTTQDDANLSRPRSNNHTSDPIERAKNLAGTLGISDFPDVGVVLNSIKVFAWCLHLLEVLMRKPTVEEVRYLLSLCDGNSFKIPESKCIRMLRSMSSRAQLWQSKAKKALAADSKAQNPYDLNMLKELFFAAKQIPLTMPEEARLWNTIEDKGCRHCICGGPSDGSFMLCCDNCDNWYHGICMKLDQAASDALAKWICPHCSGKTSAKPVQVNGAKPSANDTPTPMMGLNPLLSTSPHAPNPVALWPPFGLRSSSTAAEALGKMGESDNEDFDFSRKPAAKSAAPISAPKKEDAVSKSSLGSVAAAHKAEKANGLSAKQAIKASVPKTTMKIPATQMISKGLVTQARSNAVPVTSLPKQTIGGASKVVPKSTPSASQLTSAAIKMSKPSTSLQALKHTAVDSVPKVSIKAAIPSGSAVRPSQVQGIPSNKLTVTKQLVKNSSVKVIHATSVPVATAASKTDVKKSPTKPSFVVPRDTAKLMQSANPITARLPTSSPIKYPKPENGAAKSINGTNTEATIITSSAAIKATAIPAKDSSLPPNNSSTSNGETNTTSQH